MGRYRGVEQTINTPVKRELKIIKNNHRGGNCQNVENYKLQLFAPIWPMIVKTWRSSFYGAGVSGSFRATLLHFGSPTITPPLEGWFFSFFGWQQGDVPKTKTHESVKKKKKASTPNEIIDARTRLCNSPTGMHKNREPFPFTPARMGRVEGFLFFIFFLQVHTPSVSVLTDCVFFFSLFHRRLVCTPFLFLFFLFL